jgi:bacterioferritin
MGKKGREIVKVDIDDLLNDLYKAYADEWIAYFYYKWAADVAAGMGSKNFANEVDRIAEEEEEHAEELSERILELGGEPERDWEDVQKIANCPKVKFPKDVTDLKGMVKELVEAEGCAIDVYTKIIEKLSPCYNKDLKTFNVISHILEEEIEHEEAFENLLQ